MNAAVGQNPAQMRGASGFLHRGDISLDAGLAGEFAALNGGVDAAQVHLDDAAGAYIHVADLGISHLADRQSDVRTISDQRVIRTRRHQTVEIGGVSQSDGIALGLFAQAPAIEDTQHYRPRIRHRECPIFLLCHTLRTGAGYRATVRRDDRGCRPK